MNRQLLSRCGYAGLGFVGSGLLGLFLFHQDIYGAVAIAIGVGVGAWFAWALYFEVTEEARRRQKELGH